MEEVTSAFVSCPQCAHSWVFNVVSPGAHSQHSSPAAIEHSAVLSPILVVAIGAVPAALAAASHSAEPPAPGGFVSGDPSQPLPLAQASFAPAAPLNEVRQRLVADVAHVRGCAGSSIARMLLTQS